MVGLHHIVLLLIELITHHHLVWILLSIDGALLQADIHLREGHGCWVGSQLLPELQVIGILHRTDLLSLEIIQRLHRLIGGHHTETLVGIAQKLVATLLVHLTDVLHKSRIVHYPTHIADAIEKHRHIKHCDIGHKGHLRRCVLHHEGDVCIFTRFQQFSVPSHYTIRIDLYAHASLTQAIDFLGKLLCIELSHRIVRTTGAQGPSIALSPIATSCQYYGQQKHHIFQ